MRLPLPFAALVAALPLAGGCATLRALPPSPAAGDTLAIYDGRGRPLEGLERLVDALSGVDVVFVGEDHEDAAGHRFELALLRALAARARPVVVGLEMFERDVQPVLDAYLSNALPESELTRLARPWPSYASDYRGLVELARVQGWPVVGTNVPRHLAAAVSRAGLDTLATLDPAIRAHAAAELVCPRDDYHRRFMAEMAGMPAHGGPEGREEMLLRYYLAQCLKDETMAESIVRAQRPGSLTVHFNGAFHSDHRQGTVPRVLRRAPGLRVATVSVIPVTDPRRFRREHRVADYVVLTPRSTDRPGS